MKAKRSERKYWEGINEVPSNAKTHDNQATTGNKQGKHNKSS
jgi:hypothetical protein